MTTEYVHLSAEERGAIMAMKQQGCTTRLIGRTLKRAPSTVSRELLRNGWRRPNQDVRMGRPLIAEGYNAVQAGKRARRVRRASRQPRKLCKGSALWCCVRGMLDQLWSPQQIAASSSETILDNPACKPRTRPSTQPSMPGPRESFVRS